MTKLLDGKVVVISGVGPGLCVNAGFEEDRHENRDAGKERHERTVRPGPLGRHASLGTQIFLLTCGLPPHFFFRSGRPTLTPLRFSLVLFA